MADVSNAMGSDLHIHTHVGYIANLNFHDLTMAALAPPIIYRVAHPSMLHLSMFVQTPLL